MVKRWLRWFSVGILVIILAVAGLLWSLARPPAFYAEEMARTVAPEVRLEQAKVVEQRTERVVESVKRGTAVVEKYEQEQLNNWLAQEVNTRSRDAIPAQIHDPRIRLGQGEVEIVFRAEDPRTKVKTYVSVLARPEVTPPARLKVEILEVRAGALPLPMDKMLDEISGRLKKRGWNVAVSKSDGHDVVTIDFSAHLKKGAQIKSLQIDPGVITLDLDGDDSAARR